jgi:hypothetical protein
VRTGYQFGKKLFNQTTLPTLDKVGWTYVIQKKIPEKKILEKRLEEEPFPSDIFSGFN